jgi:hypothetical protein
VRALTKFWLDSVTFPVVGKTSLISYANDSPVLRQETLSAFVSDVKDALSSYPAALSVAVDLLRAARFRWGKTIPAKHRRIFEAAAKIYPKVFFGRIRKTGGESVKIGEKTFAEKDTRLYDDPGEIVTLAKNKLSPGCRLDRRSFRR